MRRILFDCRVVSERLDGLSRYTLGLVEALAREPDDCELTLILPSVLSERHRLRALAALPGVRSISSDARIMRIRDQLRMRAVFAQAPRDLYHYPHFDMPITAPRPAVVTIHDVTPLAFPHYFARWRHLKRASFWIATMSTIARARAVIVPSHSSAAAIAALFPAAASRLHVVHEGVDPVLAQEPAAAQLDTLRANLRIQHPFLLYVGVNRPHKNLSGLLRAFAAVVAQVPHHLLLAGQPLGDSDELGRLCHALHIEDRVRWLGYQPDENLRGLYRMADAFVLCSFFEGFGLPVIEAMANGAPAIVPDTGAAAEVAGEAALRVDPRSTESIARALIELCTNERHREELRRKGNARAAAFTWRRAAIRTREIYAEVLDRRSWRISA